MKTRWHALIESQHYRLRLLAAKFAVYRLRRRRVTFTSVYHQSTALIVLLVALSGFTGFLLGQHVNSGQRFVWVPATYQQLRAASTVTSTASNSATLRKGNDPQMLELGRLRAQLIRLRAIFVRLAEIARLEEGEFDLDLEPLSGNSGDASLLKQDLAHMTAEADILQRIYDERRLAGDLKISGKPVINGSLSSRFGHRLDPFSGEWHNHRGIDFNGEPGEPVLALADGVVSYSGPNGGYGNLVELEHDAGYRTRYAHNQVNIVTVGEHVRKGGVVATLGSTGRSTGPHVHLEVRFLGTAVDPALFVR